MKKKSLFMLLLIVLFSNAAFAEFQTNSMKVFRDLTVFGAATVKGPATITGTVKLADESLQISKTTLISTASSPQAITLPDKSGIVVLTADGNVDITNDSITAAKIASPLTFDDGDKIDLSQITEVTSTDEGLFLPLNSGTPTGANGEGQITWDSSNDKLYIGTSSTIQEIGSGDISAINTNSGSGLTGGAIAGGVTLNVNVDDSTIEIVGNTIQVKNNAITASKIGQTCADGQVLKNSGGGTTWACADDNTGGGGSITYATNNKTVNTNVLSHIYVSCSSGSPIGGGCSTTDPGSDDFIISCPATGENTCTASSPTGWNCSYWIDSSSTITAYVICQ
ncbi:exported hypothetical protein [Candidatus Magnetomoraceae bacterium gMMP-15]